MEYIRSDEIDPFNTFFHFSRIDNRESIETNGLQAVAGGENEATNDKNNRTIYFSKGLAGALKAVDVWARWEYSRYAKQETSNGHEVKQDYEKTVVEGKDTSYDKEIMRKVIFKKLYDDFKNRQYYTVDLVEGKDGDFEYGDIDVKKVLSRDKDGRPYPGSLWKYGPYSDFGTPDDPNNKQEDWNMNTKTGKRIISADRLKIVETQKGRSDGLSVIIEAYDKFRGMVPKENDSMYEILDDFITYAKDRMLTDNDFVDGSADFGKRDVDIDEASKFQHINHINEPNPVISFFSKFIHRIKNSFKQRMVKKLPEASEVIKPADDINKKREDFLEGLRKTSEIFEEQKHQPSRTENKQIIKNDNDGPSLDD